MQKNSKENTDTLLSVIKRELNITWEDEETDKKILGMIGRGQVYLSEAVGGELDFISQGKPLELLIEYVRYARSAALDEFQKNYLHELRWLQIGKELGRYDKPAEQG